MISEDWLFLLLLELIPKSTTCPYFFGVEVETVESTHIERAYILTSGTFVVTRHAWFARTPRLEKDGRCSDQMSLTGFDKTCLQETHATGTLGKKNLSRTWEDLDSCMAQSSGPRDNYISRCLFLCQGKPKSGSPLNRFMCFPIWTEWKKNACCQNSEPSELGRVYKQTALLLLLTVAPTSSLFFYGGQYCG